MLTNLLSFNEMNAYHRLDIWAFNWFFKAKNWFIDLKSIFFLTKKFFFVFKKIHFTEVMWTNEDEEQAIKDLKRVTLKINGNYQNEHIILKIIQTKLTEKRGHIAIFDGWFHFNHISYMRKAYSMPMWR